jgi:hypothetical protein
MEVDTGHALVNSFGKFALTDRLDSNGIRDGTELVELSEEVVEINLGTGVLDKTGPVSAVVETGVLVFK